MVPKIKASCTDMSKTLGYNAKRFYTFHPPNTMKISAKSQHKLQLLGTILVTLLLAGCGGSAVPQDETPDDTGAAQTQQQTQQTATFTSPHEGWTLHMTVKKLFPGNAEMTVHKYCKSVIGNMMQCQLYDGNDGDSRLVGVETMVGSEMYSTFTADEKKLWMPTKDLMQTTMASMPDLDAEQFNNVAQSLSNKYSKVYLLWDPGRINLPTGSPIVTVMNTAVATGTTSSATNTGAPAAGSSATPGSTPAAAPSAPTNDGGYTFAAFDIAKVVAGGLDQKKGNFESSILQTGSTGSVQVVSLKGTIGSHTFTNTTQIIYIVSGSGEFTVGDKKQSVSSGMVVVIPNGTDHSFKNSGTKDNPLVFVNFKTPFDDTNVKWN